MYSDFQKTHGGVQFLIVLMSMGIAPMVARWAARCPMCNGNTASVTEIAAAVCPVCGVSLREPGSGGRQGAIARLNRLNRSDAVHNRLAAWLFSMRGLLLFCCGPLLFACDEWLIMKNHVVPQPLFLVPALAAMFAGGLIMLTGQDTCVVCGRRDLFASGKRFVGEWSASGIWVCSDCMLPFEKPLLLAACPYCRCAWHARNRYEQHLAGQNLEALRCRHCGAPVEPVLLKQYPE